MNVWGATPEPKQQFFGILQFKDPQAKYPKTPLLASGVQWYGCLGRHPKTQTILLGIFHLKYPHPRYPKTPLQAALKCTMPKNIVWVLGWRPKKMVVMVGSF